MTLTTMALALACVPMLAVDVEIGPSRRIALNPDARFSVTYWHSMYDAPVTETFVVAEKEIRLLTVRTPDPRVLEYLEIDGPVDTEIAVERHFPSIPFRVATREAQTLVVGGRRQSFREFGAPGARIVFTPICESAKKPAP